MYSKLNLAFGLSAIVAAVQGACVNLTSNVQDPVVAAGYQNRLFANGFNRPRSLIFDPKGRLLVVEQFSGVQIMDLDDQGGTCVSVKNKRTLISDHGLNHGIALSGDATILYVSSVEAVYAYIYNVNTGTVSAARKTLINGMTNTDHVTRTLLFSKKSPGTLVVARGSAANYDPLANDVTTGHAQVRAFRVRPAPSTPYNFSTSGTLLAWGVRNEVGVAEHPQTGGIWGVENSYDAITRLGQNFQENNPGEELNYFGTLVNNTSPNQGKNFGYPQCFATFAPNAVPSKPAGLKVGQQFALDPNNAKYTDAYCKSQTVAPRITFIAHSAPLDIKFTSDGNTAFVTQHGSHNRAIPSGYAVTRIVYANGNPVDPSTSKKALINVISQPDTTKCPDDCIRPVGLALDGKGRLFYTSDATGELYVVTLP